MVSMVSIPVIDRSRPLTIDLRDLTHRVDLTTSDLGTSDPVCHFWGISRTTLWEVLGGKTPKRRMVDVDRIPEITPNWSGTWTRYGISWDLGPPPRGLRPRQGRYPASVCPNMDPFWDSRWRRWVIIYIYGWSNPPGTPSNIYIYDIRCAHYITDHSKRWSGLVHTYGSTPSMGSMVW